MSQFRFKAVSAGNELVEGEIDASSEEDAVERIRARGLLPLRIEAGRGRAAGARGTGLSFGRGASTRQVAIVTRELATLLEAGLPLDSALGMLADLAERAKLRKLLEGVRSQVQQGATFAEALAASDARFPPYYQSMIQAGEAGGSLGLTLSQIADFMETEQAAEDQTRSALIYPMLLLVLSVGSIAIFITAVLPQFAPLFEDGSVELPAFTRFLMDLSGNIERHGWALIAGLVGFLLLMRLARQSTAIARLGDRLRLSLPLIGPLLAATETARFARTLAALLKNGVPLLRSLSIARGTLANLVFQAAVDEAATEVEAGGRLAAALGRCEALPRITVHLIAVGERSGQLEPMLERLATILERETAEMTKRLLTLLVPVLTIGSAGIIAVVIGSIMTALLNVYDLAG